VIWYVCMYVVAGIKWYFLEVLKRNVTVSTLGEIAWLVAEVTHFAARGEVLVSTDIGIDNLISMLMYEGCKDRLCERLLENKRSKYGNVELQERMKKKM
jgi:hypothetical protein